MFILKNHFNQSAELWREFLEQVYLEASDAQIRSVAGRFDDPGMHEKAIRYFSGMGRAKTAWDLYGGMACARLYQADPAIWLGHLDACAVYASERPETFVESLGQVWTDGTCFKPC